MNDLKQQIKTLEEEKMQYSGFENLSNEIEKLQVEIANKVAYIE